MNTNLEVTYRGKVLLLLGILAALLPGLLTALSIASHHAELQPFLLAIGAGVYEELFFRLLLLGGVFTMIHGVGLCIATDTSIARFLVMTFALSITLVLGYVRFVRRRVPSVARGGDGTTDGEGLGDLESRIRALEQRMEEAANALGHRGDR